MERYDAKEFLRLFNLGRQARAMPKPRLVDTSSPGIERLYKFDQKDYIFIPGTVYSSKNSKAIYHKKPKPGSKTKWFYYGKPVVPYITDSVPVKRYKNEKAAYYLEAKSRFKQMCEGITRPIFIELIFVMPDTRIWDFNNISQLVQDMMVANGWIPGDDVRNIFTIPPLKGTPQYYYNKESPGVFIRVKN